MNRHKRRTRAEVDDDAASYHLATCPKCTAKARKAMALAAWSNEPHSYRLCREGERLIFPPQRRGPKTSDDQHADVYSLGTSKRVCIGDGPGDEYERDAVRVFRLGNLTKGGTLIGSLYPEEETATETATGDEEAGAITASPHYEEQTRADDPHRDLLRQAEALVRLLLNAGPEPSSDYENSDDETKLGEEFQAWRRDMYLGGWLSRYSVSWRKDFLASPYMRQLRLARAAPRWARTGPRMARSVFADADAIPRKPPAGQVNGALELTRRHAENSAVCAPVRHLKRDRSAIPLHSAPQPAENDPLRSAETLFPEGSEALFFACDKCGRRCWHLKLTAGDVIPLLWRFSGDQLCAVCWWPKAMARVGLRSLIPRSAQHIFPPEKQQ